MDRLCRIYLVLEYIPRVLSSVIAEHRNAGGLPLGVIWDLLRQLLLAVRFMHQQQVCTSTAHTL